uniref:3-hydroxyisobutyryl-CoA hydrolase n=1 Tax=Solanum lycopersicum TaxID=4081 RepID=A0A3Q7EKQ5_SOLLC
MAQTSCNNGETDQVLVEERGSVRTFILNRPKQLNALSFQMISRLAELFYASEEDSNVKMIILKGHGRAFCAGGDLSTPFHIIHQGNWQLGANYIRELYTLIYMIATYRKPQSCLDCPLKVSILNGIVMGAGAGVSIHGRFRVATEKSVFAMPETAMGLFPDVGSSYFLSRLPGFFGNLTSHIVHIYDENYCYYCGKPFPTLSMMPIEFVRIMVMSCFPFSYIFLYSLAGEYAGLTGFRLDGAEMFACGLATHFVSSDKLPLLEQALVEVNTSDPDAISAIISHFSHIPKLKEGSPYHKMKIINHCFSRRTIEEIISTLESKALDKKDDWISSTIQLLKKASPTSLKITLRLIREGRLQGVDSCLVREYGIFCHVLRGEFNKDILEGFRAIIIEKDRNPKWDPSGVELVRDDDVDRYYTKIDDEDWEDLKLPPRSYLPPPHAIAKL